MTTILDTVKTPDVVTPIHQSSLDGDRKSSGRAKFADMIEQTNINNQRLAEEKKHDKSMTNNEIDDADTALNDSDEAGAVVHENDDDSSSINSLLPVTQSKVELKAVAGYTSTATNNLAVSAENKLQVQLAVNTNRTSESGNKLPGDGQIQPVAPPQTLVSSDSRQQFPEGFEFKNQFIQKEFESNLEAHKIVNLNPVKAKANTLQLNPITAEIQAATVKGPKDTIQPIDLGNIRISSHGENPNLKIAADTSLSTQQVMPISAGDNIEGITKPEYLASNKPHGELQQFIETEVKVKNSSVLNQWIKTDSVAESTTTTTSQSQHASSVNLVSATPTPSSDGSQVAKLTTMTMQAGYSPGTKEWSENFSRNIALMAVSKNNLAEIRLDPPELGAIQVRITHTGSETNLQFQVNQNDTRQAIEASIQRLKESLAEHGFTNVNVDIQQGEQSQTNDPQSNQSIARAETTSEEGIFQEQTSILQLHQLPSSGIDFFA